MQITYSYPSGRRVVAVVLAVGADFIRVAAPGRSDGFDLHLRDLDWVTETGSPITVDAILFERETSPTFGRFSETGPFDATDNQPFGCGPIQG